MHIHPNQINPNAQLDALYSAKKRQPSGKPRIPERSFSSLPRNWPASPIPKRRAW
jgi:hypothetical protein